MNAEPETAILEAPTDPVPEAWTIRDSMELYNLEGWGNDFFSVNGLGNVVVHPGGPGTAAIDLKELVDEVRERGIAPPFLFRFSEILQARVVELNEAFRSAIAEYGYKGIYRGVYPIKVNQDRFLVERLARYGKPYHFGLEAGSKPELLAVMAMLEDPEALIICNGYKDEEYVETALLTSRLGRTVILVVEKFSELPLIERIAKETGIRPRLGLRARLSARGAGHWEESGGDRAKFGLSASDLVAAVEYLRKADLLDCLELVHFHLGSQISHIRSVKEGIREAAWTYTNLAEMGAHGLKYLDVGGGLGVDYNGTQTDIVSSMNYSLQEYVNDVVYGVQQVCDNKRIPHPTLVTESGRATVAHHAVLVVDTLGVVEYSVGPIPGEPPPGTDPLLQNLFDAYREVTPDNLLEVYHDALSARDDCRSLFNLGRLSLADRALGEDVFLAVCRRIWEHVKDEPEVPEEFEGLATALADTYFLNFSVFQSAPDSWAIDQLFPILPIHRLDEEPTKRGVLADITCDSDGKIDHFIDRWATKPVLELHPYDGREYYLGVFLVGAYQEILGDLHNLFGDTNTVNVSLGDDGDYEIDEVEPGDTVADALQYVSYSRRDLLDRVRRSVETALRRKTMTLEESRQLLKAYDEGLSGYTYLEHE
ncbi:MAG: biosynthetic arginine decarboxylase [Thermoanaerobaculia bacterium]|nr:biosynthetic arginine decarboxylase [Thermoanaerobaculia bacterium]